MRREVAADRLAVARIDALYDRLAIERMADRAANPDIVQRLALVVHHQHRLSLSRADADLEALVFLELRHILAGNTDRDRIDVTGLHGGNHSTRIGDEAEFG